MKSIKRGLAVMLAVMLLLPGTAGTVSKVIAAEAVMNEAGATYGNAVENTADEVLFNTGNHVFSVVNEKLFAETGDAVFGKDGSYTINIPEDNPFFPYEVQFTCGEVTENKWFMTPDDCVEVGGHKFYVSAYFDDTAVTQMRLNVAGKEVTVYPEEKEFSNNEEGGIAALSLLPLEEKYLTVDLTGFTPLELSMVSIGTLFAGNEEALEGAGKVVWTAYAWDDDYSIGTPDDLVNISENTSSSKKLQVILGDGDQLNKDNVRYIINAKTTDEREWLIPEVYIQDAEGNRTLCSFIDCYFDSSQQQQYIRVPYSELGDRLQAYVSLSINSALFTSTAFDYIKVYEGQYYSADEAVAGKDITEQIFSQNMSQSNAGYQIRTASRNQWITMVAYTSDGTVMGCLPFFLNVRAMPNRIKFLSLNEETGIGSNYLYYGYSTKFNDGYYYTTVSLCSGFPVDGIYYLKMVYDENSTVKINNSAVTAAYVGQYDSIATAEADKAMNIKDSLFTDEGYAADYSKGIYFSVFVGEDGTENQEIHHYCVKTEAGTNSKYGNSLNHGTGVDFIGLKGPDGSSVSAYVVDRNEDSYGRYNYISVLVDDNVDLTQLAPVFDTSTGIHLYASGSSSPEESGKNYHDFSNGSLQYTASAENGTDSANYWLSVVKASEGAGKLFINGLSDSNSDTRTDENGVIYTNREVHLDSLYGEEHDILLANMGKESISNLSVELISDVVCLDDYWTLSGSFDLSGFTTAMKTTAYGELNNLAKLRIAAKDGVEIGTDVSGTLTVKSGDTPLAVFNLTGSIGDPCITTMEIPQAVKYVPYGTMIQNSNKYTWNKTTYSLLRGSLPEGMEVKPNGEIYGVAKETGEFTFTVRMTNSYSGFSNSDKTYTLVIAENTDENVDGATDIGYDLTERITDVNADGSYLMVSQGEMSEFKYVYLDGEKLVEGEDYTAESGSTRITIEGQTLTDAGPGTHTLGVEFRTENTDTLKRAAQNYTIGDNSGNGSSDDNNDSSDDNSDSSDNNDDGSDNNDDSSDDNNDSNIMTDNTVAFEENYQGNDIIASDSTTVYTIRHITDASQFLNISYKNAEAYDISLNDSTAAFPITVVMTAPEGFDMSRTMIMHLTSQNEIDEIFYNGNGYTYNASDNKVTFTVTHFSPFVFVELNDNESEAPAESTVVSDTIPKTADTAQTAMLIFLLLLSGGIGFAALTFKRII